MTTIAVAKHSGAIDLARTRAEARLVEAEARGIPCHIRRWHNGSHGWFVVRNDNYERYCPLRDDE